MKFFLMFLAFATLANASLLRRKTFKLKDGTVIVRTDIEKHTTVIKPGAKTQELLGGSDEDKDSEEMIPRIDVSELDQSPWSRMDKKIPLMTERIPNKNVMDGDLQKDLMLRRILQNEDFMMNWKHQIDEDSAMDQKLRWMLEKKNPMMGRIMQRDPSIEDALEMDRRLLIDRNPSLNLQDFSGRDLRPWWMFKKISPAINIDEDPEIDERLKLMLRNDDIIKSSTSNMGDISDLGHDQRWVNMRTPMMDRLVQTNPNVHAGFEMRDPILDMMLLQDQNLRNIDDASKTNNVPWFLLHKNTPMMKMMVQKNPLILQRTPEMMRPDILPLMDGTPSQPLRFKKTFKKFNPWMSKPRFGMDAMKPSDSFFANRFPGLRQNARLEDFGASYY